MGEGTLSERVNTALIVALVRKGVLDEDDICVAADHAEDGSEDGDAAAHLMRCALLEVNAPSPSEWRAQQARKRMRIVPDGGRGPED